MAIAHLLNFLLGLVTMRLRGVFVDLFKTLNEAEYSVYPAAASRRDRMFVVKIYYKIEEARLDLIVNFHHEH